MVQFVSVPVHGTQAMVERWFIRRNTMFQRYENFVASSLPLDVVVVVVMYGWEMESVAFD